MVRAVLDSSMYVLINVVSFGGRSKNHKLYRKVPKTPARIYQTHILKIPILMLKWKVCILHAMQELIQKIILSEIFNDLFLQNPNTQDMNTKNDGKKDNWHI